VEQNRPISVTDVEEAIRNAQDVAAAALGGALTRAARLGVAQAVILLEEAAVGLTGQGPKITNTGRA
jgi:hypothetical protein